MNNNTMIKRNGNAAFGLENVIDSFFGSTLRRFMDGNFYDAESTASTGSVPVNVREQEHHYEVDVVAPGCRKEDFSVTVQRNTLTVSFEQKSEDKKADENGGWSRTEFMQRSFKRSFTMDDTVDPARITANYKDGILQLQIPKSEQALTRNRLIEIQ